MEDKMEHNDIRDLVKDIRKAKSRNIFTSRSIKVKTRKLKTEWTTEMAYDISQYSGIDSSIEESIMNSLLKELGNDRDTI
jgi:hypothetical protein